MFVYIQIYTDIYFRVSLGGLNLGTFDARKLKYGMLLTQTLTFNYVLEWFLCHSLGWVIGSNCITGQI